MLAGAETILKIREIYMSSITTRHKQYPHPVTAASSNDSIVASNPQVPITSYVRKLLNAILPGDTEFTSFVVDYYPEVAKNFGSSQNKTDKTNLLLISQDPSDICRRLRQEFPERYNEIEYGQLQQQIVRSMSISIGNCEKNAWTIRFNGELGDLSWDDIQRIILALKEITGIDQSSSQLLLSEINSGSIELVIISTNQEFQKVKAKLEKSRHVAGLSVISLQTNKYVPSFWGRLIGLKKNKAREDALVDAYFLNNYADSLRQTAVAREQIADMGREIHSLQNYISSCPKAATFQRIFYDVAVIGLSYSGKTSVIQKIVEPRLEDARNIVPTQYRKYERTMVVYHNQREAIFREHSLRFHEWGGEYLSQSVLHISRLNSSTDIVQDDSGLHRRVQAIVLLVDVGIYDSNQGTQEFNQNRINEHLKNLNETYLDFLFVDEIRSHLKAVILFVNKCDLMSDSYDNIHSMVSKYFEPIIARIQRHNESLFAFHVIAGSAFSDMGLTRLTGHLLGAMLPDFQTGQI